MKATFLVTVETAEGASLNTTARELFDSLEDTFVVHEVKAWKRPAGSEEQKPVRSQAQQVLPPTGATGSGQL